MKRAVRVKQKPGKASGAGITLSLLALVVSCACSTSAVKAQTWTFNPSMIDGGGDEADISLFNQGVQPPGTYPVDILLSGREVDSREVAFTLEKDAKGEPYLFPCLTVDELSGYGVRTEDYPGLAANNGCADISIIPQANYDFQFASQKLQINVPQASLRPEIKGIAARPLWDDGITAFRMNYRASSSRSDYTSGSNGSQHSESSYVQLNPGLNIGAWRLRSQSNWQKQGETDGKWETLYIYAERGLYDLKSRLTLGDRSTPGMVFDGVPFRGVMLGSDDSMVPYNQRAFAPVIRGVARTQARVEVKQNGYTLYNGTVAAGPFALTDLSASGTSGGDFEVTVWETDGKPQVFNVPFQTPAISLKEGYVSYNVMTGHYRPAESGVNRTPVAQATVMYGLPWNLTAYTGAQTAKHFQSGALGLGLSAGDFGAVSVDVIGSQAQRKNNDAENGAAWRVRYSKDVVATNTTLTMTSYQYASSGYNTLSEVLDTWRSAREMGDWRNRNRERMKTETAMTLSQSLGDWGSLNLSASRRDFRSRSGSDNNFGASYGVSIGGGATVSLNWNESRSTDDTGHQTKNRITSLWLSIPLDSLPGSNTWANYQMSSSSSGRESHQAGLRGAAFDRRLNWGVNQRYVPGQDKVSNSSAANLNWDGAWGQIGGNYSYAPNATQRGIDVSGGVLVHSGGITPGQTMGETVALVAAPGAAGVNVIGGGSGISTDRRGYATQSWVTPYQENTVSLDPLGLSGDVEINQTDVRVVPTEGAVVAAKFKARTGGRALMTLSRAGGKGVPFGSLVTLESQEGNAGIVGAEGQVYLTGLPQKGVLVAKWSGGECRVSYRLPEEKEAAGVYSLNGQCL